MNFINTIIYLNITRIVIYNFFFLNNNFRKIKNKFWLKGISLIYNIGMAENNSGKKIEKKLKNKMLEDISINSKQPMAEISNLINMDKASLEKLSKSELINLVLKQEKKPKIIIEDDTKPVPARKRPIPTPRKSVKDMVQQYEDNIIIPPPEFRDDYKPIPLPRTKKPLQAPIPAPRTKKTVPEKRTIISQVEKA